ncbi:MAG: toxin-antitoxin system YwqK family antitoxin [Fusobacterium sp.]|nr:toxin-antitoxin system YwqK family antitoxin [Fusobacterium sp.]
MKKWNKILILGGFLFYFATLQSAEIKELQLLDDYSNEIMGTNKKISNSLPQKQVILEKENVEIEKTSSETTNNAENLKVKPDSIVDIFEKEMKNGIAYKKGETQKFSGYFGAVIDGQIDHYESYKDGLLDGESAWFSKDGRKLLSEKYSKGKLHGEQNSFYDNGKLKSTVKYINGRVNGVASYNKDGKVLHKSDFKDGSGTWKFYWSNGKLSEEGQYTSWKKDGTWKKYREDGSLDMTTTYDKGRLLKERWE